MATKKVKSENAAADAASDESKLEKCPGCHAYFVKHGELCANCEAKE